jgi:nitrite reductase/ring-hydroxylating ferredoxin subunit
MPLRLKPEEIVAHMEREGYRFSRFSLRQEGAYAPSDADWNQKDVVHVNFVHPTVRSCVTVVEPETSTVIFNQSSLGLRFPLAITSYQHSDGAQLSYFSLFFFIFVIDTRYEASGTGRTQVTTEYHIGAPPWLTPFVPVLRWMLKRNYQVLMSVDVPMRERRGTLRTWGYRFTTDGAPIEYDQTVDIGQNHVCPPDGVKPPATIQLSVERDLRPGGEYLVGRDDHLGLRLVLQGTRLVAFPRMCPHEGASTDRAECQGTRLICPWHGRGLRALISLDLAQDPTEGVTSLYRLRVEGDVLTIEPRPRGPETTGVPASLRTGGEPGGNDAEGLVADEDRRLPGAKIEYIAGGIPRAQRDDC